MVSALGPLLDELASAPAREDPSVPLRRATRLSYTLGLIHPYLDGNGHVQRLAFAAAVMASPGLRLRGAWTAHPRPYDAEAMMRRFEVADVGARLDGLLDELAPYVERA